MTTRSQSDAEMYTRHAQVANMNPVEYMEGLIDYAQQEGEYESEEEQQQAINGYRRALNVMKSQQ